MTETSKYTVRYYTDGVFELQRCQYRAHTATEVERLFTQQHPHTVVISIQLVS